MSIDVKRREALRFLLSTPDAITEEEKSQLLASWEPSFIEPDSRISIEIYCPTPTCKNRWSPSIRKRDVCVSECSKCGYKIIFHGFSFIPFFTIPTSESLDEIMKILKFHRQGDALAIASGSEAVMRYLKSIATPSYIGDRIIYLKDGKIYASLSRYGHNGPKLLYFTDDSADDPLRRIMFDKLDNV